ncbi:extracellular matrix protein 2-like isoform X1 [Crotalus tigris]|uniref:extracellular matrix protein 2-like isoform X1 n=1 Tax=Crotalus tigris TaxID=88082 RepID=UPI00192F26B9|nr:extracellular matrix protein 2-like isoform X1 [Crotalus tigris]
MESEVLEKSRQLLRISEERDTKPSVQGEQGSLELPKSTLTEEHLSRFLRSAELPRSAATKVKSPDGEKELPLRSRKLSIPKNTALKRKVPIHLHQDDQTWKKGDRVGKKMLGVKKTESRTLHAISEAVGLETNSSLTQARSRYEPEGLILNHATTAPVQGNIAIHRKKARKGNARKYRTMAQMETGQALDPQHRNESWIPSFSVYKRVIRIKERSDPVFLDRNVTWVLLQKQNRSTPRNISRSPTGKVRGTFKENDNCTVMWEECGLCTRNSTHALREKEARLLYKHGSPPPKGKLQGTPSANVSVRLPGEKQRTFQKIGEKRTGIQAELAKGSVTLCSQAEDRKDSTTSLQNASQPLLQKKLSLTLREASGISPGKRPSSQLRNVSWAAENKAQSPFHRNASWSLPSQELLSPHRNVNQALTRTEDGFQSKNSVQVQLGNTTQSKTRRGQNLPHKNVSQRRTGSPKQQPVKPKERKKSTMPSLPPTCLLSEHAIACGNAHLKYVPKLTDSVLKTLYLAENEINNIPAGVFLGLPNLEWLDLSKNKLKSAGLHPEAFKNLTKLKRLNLDGNQLTLIPALPSSLHELKLNDNNLAGLQRRSFTGLFKLFTLELEGNQLHDGNVSPTAFTPLGKLIYLRLDRNHFRTIPSGLPASLLELHLDSNRVEEVTEGVLNRTLNLTVLVLSNNKLQEDRIAPRAWIDLLKLEVLDLSHNHLVHVPSFLPRHLKQLTLHHNRIERVPGYVFAHMKPGLEFLHLSHNVLRDDGVHAVSFLGLYHSLAELLLDNNRFEAIPHGIINLKGLQVLRLSHNRIRHVPLNSLCDTRVSEDSNIVSVRLEHNLIDRRRIPPTAFSCIKAYPSVILRPQQNEDDY